MKTSILITVIVLSILGSAGSASAQYPILDFGQVAVGQYRDDSLPYINTTPDSTIIYGLQLSHSFSRLGPDSIGIGAYDTVQIHFRFQPTAPGRDSLLVYLDPMNPTQFIGTGIASSVIDLPVSVPGFNLVSYPNPASSSITISYDLVQFGTTVLAVFDINGNEIATLADESETVGEHVHAFEIGKFPSGQYICRLTTTNANGETLVSSCNVTIER
jgi:Secretion system C-terminal sorting domain